MRIDGHDVEVWLGKPIQARSAIRFVDDKGGVIGNNRLLFDDVGRLTGQYQDAEGNAINATAAYDDRREIEYELTHVKDASGLDTIYNLSVIDAYGLQDDQSSITFASVNSIVGQGYLLILIRIDGEMVAVHDIQRIEEERTRRLYYIKIDAVGDFAFGNGDTEDIYRTDGVVDVLCEKVAPWAQIGADMLIHEGINPNASPSPLTGLIKGSYQKATTLSAMRSALEDWGLTMTSGIAIPESALYGPPSVAETGILRREGDSLRISLERESRPRALYPIDYPIPTSLSEDDRVLIDELIGIAVYPSYGDRNDPNISRHLLPVDSSSVLQAQEIQDEAVHGFDDAANPPGAWIDRLIAITEQVPGREAVSIIPCGNPQSPWPALQLDESFLDKGNPIAAFAFLRWRLQNESTTAQFTTSRLYKMDGFVAHPGRILRVGDTLPNLLAIGERWRVERARHNMTPTEGWQSELTLRLYQGDFPVGGLLYDPELEYAATGPNHPLGLMLPFYDDDNAVVSVDSSRAGVRPPARAGVVQNARRDREGS